KDSKKAVFTARDIVNDWDEENIADVLFGYGGEKFSRRIAKNIVEARKEKPIETTFDLVEIIEKSIPSKFKNRAKIHPATKTFQALRIAVNDELGALKEGLEKGFDALAQNGRMAVVSFHSSEDKIVKNFMRDKKIVREGILIFKKPLIPSREEIIKNPRSRSAKLRVIERI
ncbi:16S rRNA (cytosine(1402)-N(4))-methyltransferase RsmH, partial [Patescibacteria group bacterium]|nr:16S rRNA (cytosine(1402)-N(4))-methyltransferase RsmH [Patescibacteria group bacterium]